MKTLLVIILAFGVMVVMPAWVINNPVSWELRQQHDMKSVHPYNYYSIVFRDTLSTATIQKLAGETIQSHPQYDSVIINRIFPISTLQQPYTVTNDSGIVIFIFCFFSRHMELDGKRSIVCVYDSTNQDVSHLGEWTH